MRLINYSKNILEHHMKYILIFKLCSSNFQKQIFCQMHFDAILEFKSTIFLTFAYIKRFRLFFEKIGLKYYNLDRIF